MYFSGALCADKRFDAVLVGAGIMSSTLAVLLHELDPDLRLLMIERLEGPGLESSSALNNAGTGHAANCELNYTPLSKSGGLDISKALAINAAFEQSLELWSSLTELGNLNPEMFLNVVPHISFVWGDSNVAFLEKRFKALTSHKAFSSMEWSRDRLQMEDWMPLVIEGRNPSQRLAATRFSRGTDVDFGVLTSQYIDLIKKKSALSIKFSTEVIELFKHNDELWHIALKGDSGTEYVHAPFVFLGAGGGALSLLQKSGIPEGLDYGGFPVSGLWLICEESHLANRHQAKVYGKAQMGAPPMSVPHLDTRWIDGKRSLLFGPFAGFSTKFLKNGSALDLFRSVKSTNLSSMIDVGVQNFDLVKYLLAQLRLNNEDRVDALREFLPKARKKDWRLSIAGQRVQIIKRTNSGGTLQMGTEVVSSQDGSLAALLGASPGASTAVTIMLEVLRRCWGARMESKLWKERLQRLLPSYGKDLTIDESLLLKVRSRNDSNLSLDKSS